MESRDVPDHSKIPLSLLMPKVMSVGTVSTPSSFKKARKLADSGCQVRASNGAGSGTLTVCGSVHYDEAGIYGH